MPYPTKYEPELAETLADMFNEGQSVEEVAAELKISKVTFYKWTKKYPEFEGAWREGVSRSEAWWNRIGRLGASGQHDINPTTWIFNMKNRFGWVDRIEQKVDAKVDYSDMSEDEIDKKLTALMNAVKQPD